MSTAVTLDRYAEIRAEMEAGAERDEALARAGLSAEDWAAAQSAWLDRMGAEIQCGRFALSDRYAQAFLNRQQTLMASAAPAPMTQAVVEKTASRDAAPVIVESTPTYLKAGGAEASAPAMAPVQRVNPMLAGTMAVDVSAFGAALPFQPEGSAPPGPAPSPEAAPRPVVKRAPAALSGTAFGAVMPKAPALPFASEGAPATGPASPPSPPVKRAPAALSGTSMAMVMPKGPALPFAPGAGSPASAPPVAESAPVAPPVNRAPAALSGTSMAMVTPKGPAMPFALAEAPSPIAASAVAPTATPPAPPKPNTLSGTTSFDLTPELLAAMGKQAALPFAQAPAAPPPPPPPPPPDRSLTIERYAALCAELAAAPAEQEAIFQRYGLGDPRERAAADAAWKERLGRDAAEYQRWQALFREHQARLTGREG